MASATSRSAGKRPGWDVLVALPLALFDDDCMFAAEVGA